MSKLTLNEDLFDDLDIIDVPPTDDLGGILMFNDQISAPDNEEDMGVSNMLLDCIQSEVGAINDYNSVLITLRDHGKDDFCSVIEDIILEHNKNVGKLQALLQDVSPNAVAITSEESITKDSLEDDVNPDGTLDWSGCDEFLRKTMNINPNTEGE